MRVAKAKGRLRSKQPKRNRRHEAHLVSLVHSGDYSTAEVAELFGVGRSTVRDVLEAAPVRHLSHRKRFAWWPEVSASAALGDVAPPRWDIGGWELALPNRQ